MVNVAYSLYMYINGVVFRTLEVVSLHSCTQRRMLVTGDAFSLLP